MKLEYYTHRHSSFKYNGCFKWIVCVSEWNDCSIEKRLDFCFVYNVEMILKRKKKFNHPHKNFSIFDICKFFSGLWGNRTRRNILKLFYPLLPSSLSSVVLGISSLAAGCQTNVVSEESKWIFCFLRFF